MAERSAPKTKGTAAPKCAVPKCKDEDLVSMKVSRKDALGRSIPELVRLCRSHAQMGDPHPIRAKST
jgi:hypothetical protein